MSEGSRNKFIERDKNINTHYENIWRYNRSMTELQEVCQCQATAANVDDKYNALEEDFEFD